MDLSVLAFFGLGSITSMLSVLLGGLLVFKTKRESTDSLFHFNKSGDSFNVDDGLDIEDLGFEAKPPKIIEEMNKKFKEQTHEK